MQAVEVAWYRVIVEVTLHDRLEPLSGLLNGIMRTVEELLLDFRKPGSHPLADRLSLHDKVPVPFLPADVREAEKVERLGFAFSSLFPVAFGKLPELNPARLVGVQFQPELPQPLPKILQKAIRFRPMLEPEYVIIRVPDDNNIALRTLLAPDVHPQVEYIMQIDIGKQRRNHRTLRSTHRRILPFAFLHYSRLQPLLDQAKNASVGDAVLDKLQKPIV
jgi:hypothetical protein